MGHNATLDTTLTWRIRGRGTTFSQNRHLAHFPHGFWKKLDKLLCCPNTISYFGNLCGQTGGDPQPRFSGLLHCKQENQVHFQTGTQYIWFEVCGAVGFVEQSPRYCHIDGMVRILLGQIPYRMREWWRDSIHCCFEVFLEYISLVCYVQPFLFISRFLLNDVGSNFMIVLKFTYTFFSIPRSSEKVFRQRAWRLLL